MYNVNSKQSLISFLVIAVLGLAVLNWLSLGWFHRLDLTDNDIYTLSPDSKSMVNKIDNLLTMKIYFSDNLPGEYGNNRRYLQDMVEEYSSYSNNIRYEFYQPETDEELETKAQEYGISPVQLQVIENDKLEIKKVYMGMVFIYEDEREIIPVIPNAGLEYNITSIIKKLVDKNKKTVGIATLGNQDIKTENISELLRQTYNVRNIDLAIEVSSEIEVILISGVEDSISIEEVNNLDAFIKRGGNIFIGQNRIKTDLQTQSAEEIQSNIFGFLERYGLGIRSNLVLDSQSGQISVLQNRGIFRMQSAVDYPFFPLVRNFASDQVVVNSLEQVRTLFPSEIWEHKDTLELNKSSIFSSLSFTPLFFTSNKSGTMEQFFSLNPVQNPAFNTLNESKKILAALSEIKHSNDDSISQIILVGDSRFILDDAGGGIAENTIFVINSVEYLMGDSGLISLRSREITTRPLNQDITDRSRKNWKWANRLLPAGLILVLGLFRLRKDKKRAKMLEQMYG